MTTPAMLSQIATAVESDAGASNSRNPTESGYWNRIALAWETLAGASSSANSSAEGWMKRAAVAVESYTGITGTGFNSGEMGYVGRMVYALETYLNTTFTGSLYNRLLQAITPFSSKIIENRDGTPVRDRAAADVYVR